MVRVGEFSDDVCDRLKLKVSMKVTKEQKLKKKKKSRPLAPQTYAGGKPIHFLPALSTCIQFNISFKVSSWWEEGGSAPTMLYNTRDYRDFGLYTSSNILRNTMLPSSG
jgi:hypothetical protein